MKALEKRLQQLEAENNSSWNKPIYFFFWNDGDDPEPARLKAEAEYRAEHGIPDNVDLQSIGIHGVSVEWMKSQEAA